jgi:hypothetical protein
MTAAAALALAKAHGVSISLDGSDLILESRGSIRADVLASLRQTKGDLVAALRRNSAADAVALTGDELLEALRRKGFVISITGSDRDLRDIVAERRPLFERLLTWQAPLTEAERR